jgi:hypothetical protein
MSTYRTYVGWIHFNKDRFTHSMPCLCHAHAIPMPCRVLIHTRYAVSLLCYDSALFFVKVCVVARNIRTASPTIYQIIFFVACCYHSFPRPWQMVFVFTLVTCIWDWYASDNNFVELRMAAERSRARAGTPQAVSRRPYCAAALRRTAWSDHGMASVNQTWLHCVNQMGKTHSKPSVAQHGRGTAWVQHAMCESALMVLFSEVVPPVVRAVFCIVSADRHFLESLNSQLNTACCSSLKARLV